MERSVSQLGEVVVSHPESKVVGNEPELSRPPENSVVEIEPTRAVESLAESVPVNLPPPVSLDLMSLALEKSEKEVVILRRKNDRTLKKNFELSAELEFHAKKIQELRSLRKEIEVALRAAEAGSEVLKRQLTVEKRKHRETKIRLESAFTLLDGDKKVIRWLGTLKRKKKSLFDGKAFVCLGEGPFSPDVVAAMLVGRGALQVEHVAPVEIIVVGRSGFMLDDVEEILRASRGRSIRIYSQEMVVLAIGKHCSPFDDASEGLLYHMADGHPGLQAIIDEEFGWPNRVVGSTGSVSEFLTAFAEKSPLKVQGYTTGKTFGLDPFRRQKILARVFRKDLEKIRGDHDYNAALASWGPPGRAKRLRRMAHLLAHLARQAEGKFADYSFAISDWREDLEFLKENFYTDLMRFKWPE